MSVTNIVTNIVMTIRVIVTIALAISMLIMVLGVIFGRPSRRSVRAAMIFSVFAHAAGIACLWV